MTPLEIVKKVGAHLLSQGETCMENNCCRYHYNGLSCAIGCLISDENYTPEIEDTAVRDAIKPEFPEAVKLREILEKEVGELTGDKFLVMLQLQKMHDTVPVSKWASQLTTMKLNLL